MTIRPCPQCGKQPRLSGAMLYSLQCCQIETPHCWTMERVANEWNEAACREMDRVILLNDKQSINQITLYLI